MCPWIGTRNRIITIAPTRIWASSDEPRLIFPKIACGRIPVKTKDEADLVVNKIVKYEQFPDMDRDYYRRIALCAYLEESFYGWQNIHKGR